VTVRCQPLGWRIRVPLVASQAATAAAPAAPAAHAAPTIRRGDQIQLVAISAGFTVSTLAVADQDGAPGDRIRVRTEHRSAPVIGLVLDDGRVALPGFN
jgi:flagella basal body P-ring formation protein FlgA